MTTIRTIGRKIRLKDIAAELGISPATVSLCLNDRSSRYQVKAETVRKVRDFAQKVGYVPDRAARSLKQGASRCVGLLTNHHWRAGQKCLPAVFAAEQQLTEAGFDCRQLSSGNQLEGIAQLRELGCSEIIIFDPVLEYNKDKERLWNNHEVTESFPGVTIYAVDYSVSDELQFENSSQIIKLGVKVWDFQQRLMEVMQKYYPGEMMLHSWRCSAPFARDLRTRAPELVFNISCDNPFKVGAAGAKQFLEARKKYNITNVFWGDDRMACGFINELLNAGVHIPEEINVISFDNLEFSRYLAMPLTTWGVPIMQHTKQVLNALLRTESLNNQVSLPVLSVGRSAKLTDEILAELAGYCQFANDEDYC